MKVRNQLKLIMVSSFLRKIPQCKNKSNERENKVGSLRKRKRKKRGNVNKGGINCFQSLPRLTRRHGQYYIL